MALPSLDLSIGLYITEHPELAETTYKSVVQGLQQGFNVVLLPDRQEMLAHAQHLGQKLGVKVLNTFVQGKPRAFNQLIKHKAAKYYVLIDAGVVSGPNCLATMVQVLAQNNNVGLVGPSTNLGWNEQNISRSQKYVTGYAIERVAERLAKRHGLAYQPMTPLHSLADFFYVLKHEVVQAVGSADERYGAGPCWEMDYNIRAARAGYQGVMALGAYALRKAPHERTVQIQHDLHLQAKQRYQDKFCALQLNGSGHAYESHCLGEECEHFAPKDKIEVFRSFEKQEGPTTNQNLPLVTCAMPTRGRPGYVEKAIHYFLAQDYPHKEMVVVYDQPADLPANTKAHPNIRFFRAGQDRTIGAKRNRAAQQAKGSIIVQWDDDDLYGNDRISRQVMPIINEQTDITAFTDTIFFDLENWQCWKCSDQLHQKLFLKNVTGGTMAFRRSLYKVPQCMYPNVSLREDANFLMQAINKGARLLPLKGENSYIYLRHNMNSWAFKTGNFLDARGWRKIEEPVLVQKEAHFYGPLSKNGRPRVKQGAPTPTLTQQANSAAQPPVTCIMPTANRRPYVPHAIQYFLRQSNQNAELLILVDGHDPVQDLVPHHERIRYIKLKPGHNVGQKRNLACREAQHQIIMHWDDDDWIHPDWINTQVGYLLSSQAQVTGMRYLYFYQPTTRKAWQYRYPENAKPWVAGGTLCYHKAFWQGNPFPEVKVGEDALFVWNKQGQDVLTYHENYHMYVAMVHKHNTSPKNTQNSLWHQVPHTTVEAFMQNDLGLYLQKAAELV